LLKKLKKIIKLIYKQKYSYGYVEPQNVLLHSVITFFFSKVDGVRLVCENIFQLDNIRML